jgi:hypothetical protein
MAGGFDRVLQRKLKAPSLLMQASKVHEGASAFNFKLRRMQAIPYSNACCCQAILAYFSR